MSSWGTRTEGRRLLPRAREHPQSLIQCDDSLLLSPLSKRPSRALSRSLAARRSVLLSRRLSVSRVRARSAARGLLADGDARSRACTRCSCTVRAT